MKLMRAELGRLEYLSFEHVFPQEQLHHQEQLPAPDGANADESAFSHALSIDLWNGNLESSMGISSLFTNPSPFVHPTSLKR